MWVLDHLEDLESDFSVFHRVEDITQLDGPRFFRLAHRVFAYAGVMAARYAEQERQHNPPAPAPTARPAVTSGEPVEVPLAQLQMDGIVERRSAHGDGL